MSKKVNIIVIQPPYGKEDAYSDILAETQAAAGNLPCFHTEGERQREILCADTDLKKRGVNDSEIIEGISKQNFNKDKVP